MSEAGTFEDTVNAPAFELLLNEAEAVVVGYDGLHTCLVFIQEDPDVNKGKRVDILTEEANKFIDYFLNKLNYKSGLAIGIPVFFAEDNDTVEQLILDIIDRREGLE